MRIRIKAKDKDHPERHYQCVLDIAVTPNKYVSIRIIAMLGRVTGNRAFSYEQFRDWGEDRSRVVRRVMPEIYQLLAYDDIFFDRAEEHQYPRVVELAGTRDRFGHQAGDACAWEDSIILPDGKNLLEGLGGHFYGGCEDILAKRLGLKRVRVPIEFSAGKPRQLDEARWRANWPEATDEELSVPEDELRAALIKRTPAYLRKLFQQLDSLGFHVPLEERPQFENQLLV